MNTANKKLVRVFDNDDNEITNQMTSEYREYLTNALYGNIKPEQFSGKALLDECNSVKSISFQELEQLSIDYPTNDNYKRVIAFISRMFHTREDMIDTVNYYQNIKIDRNGRAFYSEFSQVDNAVKLV